MAQIIPPLPPSPLQNRVLPTGEIVAHPARGMFTGNRGILSFDKGRLGSSRWKHPHWIICTLTHPRGKYHGPQPDHAWTPLFFLDEAVALSAGHRPCAYCRPAAYRRYKSLWQSAFGTASHTKIDKALHAARVTRQRQQIRHEASFSQLPDGAFVRFGDQPHLLSGKWLLPFSPSGYGSPVPRPHHQVQVLTPRPSLQILALGYAPERHESGHLA